MTTIAELIEMLKKLPPDTPCKTYSQENHISVEIYIDLHEVEDKYDIWF